MPPRRVPSLPPRVEAPSDELKVHLKQAVELCHKLKKSDLVPALSRYVASHIEDINKTWSSLQDLWNENDNGPAGLAARARHLPLLREYTVTMLRSSHIIEKYLESLQEIHGKATTISESLSLVLEDLSNEHRQL
jgi:hypothetical protein